jgi:hypothetical protein
VYSSVIGAVIDLASARRSLALLDTDGKPDPDGTSAWCQPAAPQVAAALRSGTGDVVSGGSALIRSSVGGTPYLVSVASLLEDRTEGWLVGIVAQRITSDLGLRGGAPGRGDRCSSPSRVARWCCDVRRSSGA